MKRFFLVPAAILLAFAASLNSQTAAPQQFVNGHPGGSCNLKSTPQFDFQDGTYWNCTGTFTGNPSDWARGTWTQVTPPSGPVAGDGKGNLRSVVGGTVTSNMLAANTIQFVSIPLTLSALQTLNTVPVQVLPAFGAGTFTEIQSCALDLKRGSAAFTGGGTVTIGYGTTAPTVAGAATIAATVFTTFAASQLVSVAGALAVNAASGVLNLPVWMQAAGSDFAVGTGATGVLDCAYRVHTGF